jgi:hypothetical protein
VNKACLKHLELTAYRLNLKDLLSGSSAPMFAVGCYNCHCLLFFCRDTQHHTYSATSNEGRTPRALDDAHSQLGDHPGLVLFRTHTHLHTTTHTSHTHTHTSWRKGDMRLRLWWSRIVIFHYIQLLGLCKVCSFMRGKMGTRCGLDDPMFLYTLEPRKREEKERKTEESRERRVLLLFYLSVSIQTHLSPYLS